MAEVIVMLPPYQQKSLVWLIFGLKTCFSTFASKVIFKHTNLSLHHLDPNVPSLVTKKLFRLWLMSNFLFVQLPAISKKKLIICLLYALEGIYYTLINETKNACFRILLLSSVLSLQLLFLRVSQKIMSKR